MGQCHQKEITERKKTMRMRELEGESNRTRGLQRPSSVDPRQTQVCFSETRAAAMPSTSPERVPQGRRLSPGQRWGRSPGRRGDTPMGGPGPGAVRGARGALLCRGGALLCRGGAVCPGGGAAPAPKPAAGPGQRRAGGPGRGAALTDAAGRRQGTRAEGQTAKLSRGDAPFQWVAEPRTHFLWGGGCLSLLPAAADCLGRRLRACRASTAGEKRTAGNRRERRPRSPRSRPAARHGTAQHGTVQHGTVPLREFIAARCSAGAPLPGSPSAAASRDRAPSTGRRQRHPPRRPPRATDNCAGAARPERRGRGGGRWRRGRGRSAPEARSGPAAPGTSPSDQPLPLPRARICYWAAAEVALSGRRTNWKWILPNSGLCSER